MRDRLYGVPGPDGYPSDVVTEELVTPLDWQAQGMAAGTPFALAHTFAQTGPFRPANVERRVPGLFFAGSGTVPGVGVPMVLISGKLAAARVGELSTGAVVGERVVPRSSEGYRRCAQLTWQYGTTYFWGAVLLPRRQRKHVYAVYALCRLADDIVDLPGALGDSAARGRPSVCTASQQRFRAALVDRGSDDPVLAAVAHTVTTCGIEPECFDRFFSAMAMDLTVTSYEPGRTCAATWRARQR